ncbi:MAG TPA: exopolysaccharide biosynthesis protein [Phenylobacterium sp.]|nr:exopolysaccharide biosynthesis protein [Phenylobacterium sp.]
MDDIIDSAPQEHRSLSDLLLTLAEDSTGKISVTDIMHHFGRRAFGAVLFILAIPNLLPLPPGSSTVLGMPLLIIAPQLALGARKPWLPGPIGRRTIDRAALSRLCRRAAPWVSRAEHLTAPRFAFAFGRFGDLMIGIVCTLLAAVLILPIPLGNMLPAAAVVTLALSLTQRDGLLTMLGYGLSLASAGVLFITGHIVVGSFVGLGAMAGLW